MLGLLESMRVGQILLVMGKSLVTLASQIYSSLCELNNVMVRRHEYQIMIELSNIYLWRLSVVLSKPFWRDLGVYVGNGACSPRALLLSI